MKEPVWVIRPVVDAIHDTQLVEHGGASGKRDDGLLDSALSRPVNLHAYGEADLCTLATAYASGITRNHPFIDGNKRTAFLVAYTFLKINGLELCADEIGATNAMLGLSAGELSEETFTNWLRENTEAG